MAIKKMRSTEAEERNKKIKDMDIEEVKKYLCMKNMQNPEKCPGCASLSTCNAGQRVMVLMNEKEKRSSSDRKSEVAKELAKSRREKTEQYIKQVLAAEDPRQFLMQNEGLDYQKARKKLDNWRRNYSKLFEGVSWAKHHVGSNKYTRKQEEQTEEKPVEEVGEISVEDFLNEMNSEPVADVEPVAETEQPKTESRVNFSEVNACGVPIELIRKEAELYTQMNKVEQQINELQNKYNMLKKAQKAVSLTMTVFSDTSADFRQTLSMIDRYDKGE